MRKNVVSLPCPNDIFAEMIKKVQKFDIKKLRKEIGMTQAEAALSMGVSTRTYQRIELEPVRLPVLAHFVLASGGKFKVPQNPFEFFEIGGKTFSQNNFTV